MKDIKPRLITSTTFALLRAHRVCFSASDTAENLGLVSRPRLVPATINLMEEPVRRWEQHDMDADWTTLTFEYEDVTIDVPYDEFDRLYTDLLIESE